MILAIYPGAWADHLFWAAALLLILTRGPGALSLDHLIERYFRRETPAEANRKAYA